MKDGNIGAPRFAVAAHREAAEIAGNSALSQDGTVETVLGAVKT